MTLTTTISRKRTILALAAALVAAAIALATAGTASAAGWRHFQLDNDRCWDASTLDANGNGYWEVAWYDLDNDCNWDTKLWNSVGGDAFAESMTHDMNEDGRWDMWLVDTDRRPGHEIVYFDDNGDGGYDRWAYVPKAAPDVSLRAHLAGVGSTVGGRASYGGVFGLVNYIAGFNGSVAYAPGDRDNDGCPDGLDNDYRRIDC
jgi:hypothetical protein